MSLFLTRLKPRFRLGGGNMVTSKSRLVWLLAGFRDFHLVLTPKNFAARIGYKRRSRFFKHSG
jgi:hypothetical protein